jgi:hypothetical protein
MPDDDNLYAVPDEPRTISRRLPDIVQERDLSDAPSASENGYSSAQSDGGWHGSDDLPIESSEHDGEAVSDAFFQQLYAAAGATPAVESDLVVPSAFAIMDFGPQPIDPVDDAIFVADNESESSNSSDDSDDSYSDNTGGKRYSATARPRHVIREIKTIHTVLNLILRAFNDLCDCSPSIDSDVAASDVPEPVGMKEKTRQWQHTIQTECLTRPVSINADTGHPYPIVPAGSAPLDENNYSSCNGREGQGIPESVYRSLYCADPTTPSLKLGRSHLSSSSFGPLLRTCDVDSVLFLAKTLGVHKGGFRLSYRPLYLYTVSQDQGVTFGGHRLDANKHVQWGKGAAAGTFGYSTYIVFPNLPRTQSAHLSDEELQVWTDKIMLPAISIVYSEDVLHHHPISFADARARASVRTENPACLHFRPSNYEIPLAEDGLAELWVEICNRCKLFYTRSSSSRLYPFKDPILVVVNHGLKQLCKAASPKDVASFFFEQFNNCFHYNADTIDDKDFWIDLASETVQRSDSNTQSYATLIRKQTCLAQWASQFSSDGRQETHIKTAEYHWAGTQDGGSYTVHLQSKHPLRPYIVQAKSYNVAKEMFSTPLKNYISFDSPNFRALCYTEQLVAQFYSAKNNNSTMRSQFRKNVLRAYLQSKIRLQSLFQYRARTFGVRQEYRIHVSLLKELVNWDDRNLEPPESPTDVPKHLNYFLFSTAVVCRFLIASINRWLVLLESLIRIGDDSSDSHVSEVQLNYGTVVALALDCLRFVFDGDPRRHHRLWRDTWSSKRGRRSDKQRTSDSEKQVTTYKGLNFKDALKKYGVPWIQEDMMIWNVDPPTFEPTVREQLALHMHSRFTTSTAGVAPARAMVTADSAQTALFTQKLRACSNDDELDECLNIAAELCVQRYTMEVLTEMEEWFLDTEVEAAGDGLDAKTKKQLIIDLKFKWRERAPEHMLAGYNGLCTRSLGVLTAAASVRIGPRSIPYIDMNQYKLARQPRTKNLKSSELWQNKIFPLFNWDRPGSKPDFPKPCAWNAKSYRTFTRRLFHILASERDSDVAERFLTSHIPAIAAKALLVIPAVEQSKFWTHTNKISGLSKLFTLQYWLARLPSNFDENQLQRFHGDRFNDPENMKTWKENYRTEALNDLITWKSGKSGAELKYPIIPISSSYIDGNIALQRAYDFVQEVEEWRIR